MHLKVKGWETDQEDISDLTSVFAGTQLLDDPMVRRKNPLPTRFCPSEGSTSDQLTQPQKQEQRQSTDENQPLNPNQVSRSQIQPETEDDSAQKRTKEASLKTAEPYVEDEFLVNKTSHGSEHQSVDDALGQMESTPNLLQHSPEAANELVGPARWLVPQNVEDACGPKVPTLGLIHQPGEYAYELVETSENTIQPTQDLVHQVADVDSFANASQRDTDSNHVEQELDPKPKQHVVPFPLDDLYLNSQDKGYEDSTPMSFSEQQFPAFTRPENCLKAEGRPPIVSPAITRSCNPAQFENGPVKLPSGDKRSGFHLDTENRKHKKLQVSPDKQSPPAEMNAQMVNSQGDSHIPLTGQIPQVKGNSATTRSWPPENLQQQSFVSENQSLPQAQMAFFPMQSVGQYGMVADNQVYNQKVENHFWQQREEQQQHMIAQHHYQEQQQFMQQQQVQQDHHCLQQQLPRLSHQQLLQLQEQQAQLMQQQQHQFYNQFLQPQEQNPMQQQHQQQIISPQMPTWNWSYYQQAMSSHSASASEFPNPQQQSRGVTQPRHSGASGSAVYPHNQLQTSHGVTPHGADVSIPSSSSSNQQHQRK